MIVAMLSYFTFVLTEIVNKTPKNIAILLVTAGGLTIFILMYVMLFYINSNQKYQMQRDMMEQFNEQQKQYFEELLEKEQRTKKFRHDATSDLIQLQNFCENKNYAMLEQYLQEMLKEITVINKKGYNVGNEIVNIILNTHFASVETISDIKVKGAIDDDINISQRDLCVIVSNLVKNAVEAVKECSQEPKSILFEVNQGKKFLQIKVENTIGEKRILIENHYPVTDKTDKEKHGFGIQNVRMVAEKYKGEYRYKIEDGWYKAEVYLQMGYRSSTF